MLPCSSKRVWMPDAYPADDPDPPDQKEAHTSDDGGHLCFLTNLLSPEKSYNVPKSRLRTLSKRGAFTARPMQSHGDENKSGKTVRASRLYQTKCEQAIDRADTLIQKEPRGGSQWRVFTDRGRRRKTKANGPEEQSNTPGFWRGASENRKNDRPREPPGSAWKG